MKLLFRKIVVAIIGWEARVVLKKYRPRIVAVTGSVGKTSTKDAIFALLSKTMHVRGSDKSFNSEIGLPLTILGRPNAWSNPLRWVQNIFDGLLLILLPARYPSWLVLEVGADRPGDISSLAPWLPVDVAVITRLPEMPVHVEFFDSPQAVVEEKASLINALKEEGTLVVYADDERAAMLKDRAAKRNLHTISFGLSKHADVFGEHFEFLMGQGHWPRGMQADICVHGACVPVAVEGVIGSHALLSLIAAAGVGEALGMNIDEITQGLRRYEPPKGRMRLLPGLKGSLIIDDTYNASPAAVTAALDTLDTLVTRHHPGGRRIAVIGDMLELGRFSVEEHRKAGTYAAGKVDLLVTVGFRARDIAEGAVNNGLPDAMILQYEDATRAGQELQNILGPDDCVLVKGSQSIRMEKTVEDIMLEPERAQELLVRQERSWKKR